MVKPATNTNTVKPSECVNTLSVRVVNEKERERLAPRGEDEAPQAPRSTTAGARIEAPKAPRGEVGCGEGVSPPHRGRALCPSPEKKFDLALNMVSFGVFWVVFFYSYLFYTQNRSSTAIGI